MAILTPDLRLVRVNDAFCDLLGRPVEHVVGHTILEFTHPDDLAPSVAKQIVDVMLTSAFVERGDADPGDAAATPRRARPLRPTRFVWVESHRRAPD